MQYERSYLKRERAVVEDEGEGPKRPRRLRVQEGAYNLQGGGDAGQEGTGGGEGEKGTAVCDGASGPRDAEEDGGEVAQSNRNSNPRTPPPTHTYWGPPPY